MTTDVAVRIRGMHATALTAWSIDAGFAMVDPSDIVADRVVGTGRAEPADVTIGDAPDRAGIEISGRSGAVESVAETFASASQDTFTWRDSLPAEAVFGGEVSETTGSGAIVATSEGDGFLPFSNADEYVETGDRLTVQVREPQPPWLNGKRAVLDTALTVRGTYVSLVADADARIVNSPGDSAAIVVERLAPDVPDGWGIDIHHGADSVDPMVLDAELGALAERVRTLQDQLNGAESGTVTRPAETIWCRFGREARFQLDEVRGGVLHTMEGHHRIKSIGRTAGSAVDLIEGYEIADLVFDPDVLLDAFGPTIGDRIRIEHGKPTGETITLGRGEVVERETDGSVTVRRTLSGGGQYDALDVPKEDGDTAETTFVEGQWWYPTVYRDDSGKHKGTYVNVGTPLEILPDRLRYVDLYIDVVKSPDGDVHIVDREELTTASHVSRDLVERAESVANAVRNAFD